MNKNLILLCDYGLDDAAATVHILNNRDKFEKIFILPVGGNMPLEVSHRNAHRLLYNYGEKLENVIVVNTASVSQFSEVLEGIHGFDGMGDILPPEYECIVPELNFDEWLETADKDCTVVSVGPCTVTLKILEKLGSVPLLIMGGRVNENANFRGYEFNQCLDVEAFAECVKYPHAVGTLDSCHNPNCNFYDIDCSGDRLLNRLCRRSAEMSKDRGDKGSFIYDLITVRYLFVPERFEIEKITDNEGNLLSMLRYVSDEKIIKLN